MPRFREASRRDCFAMAPILREADQGECAAHGVFPLDALLRGLDTSTLAVALEDDEGRSFAIYGVGPLSQPGRGAPWMLGTDAIKDNWVWFLRNTPEMIRNAHSAYPHLYNLVDARNTVHIRWLEWAGFTFGRTVPFGPLGLPFHEFMRSQECASP
jgi:hypothetical protein